MKIQKKKQEGITLIALVITIILILILAGVTLSISLGENGLFSYAKRAVEEYENSQMEEEKSIQETINKIENIMQESLIEPKTLITEVTTTNHKTIIAEDNLGNPVVIPGGFKFVGSEEDTVEDGIVIKDDDGNEFVWIPVSNTNGDNDAKTDPTAEDLIKLKNGSKVEITLGRYTFTDSNDANPGKPTLVQLGSQYSIENSDFIISTYYKENTQDGRPTGCAGAKDLGEFVKSVENNNGFYLARYEASFGSGSAPVGSYGTVGDTTTTHIMTNQKPASKPTIRDDGALNTNSSTTSIKVGDLWRYITQEDSSIVCQNMYNGEDFEAKYVESDLVNSYAWDTATVYIQAVGNTNYANATSSTNGNAGTLKNTGDTRDEKCHIFDMAGNLIEWTTEYSTKPLSGGNGPCSLRGGLYNIANRAMYVRDDDLTTCSYVGGRISPTFIYKRLRM